MVPLSTSQFISSSSTKHSTVSPQNLNVFKSNFNAMVGSSGSTHQSFYCQWNISEELIMYSGIGHFYITWLISADFLRFYGQTFLTDKVITAARICQNVCCPVPQKMRSLVLLLCLLVIQVNGHYYGQVGNDGMRCHYDELVN